ncbi:plasmid recombination protein [Streptococcus agalactiae]|uniref:plasmid recombination protein n=3 Tax=Streptococcus agalactiae TaxID=1311 RepID=UPI0002BB2C09|nr:plasmid recombination protein [Streptococcus agalactiae]EPX34871.1 hypothetical protein SAG0089_09360 [Streptococcus agalactiae LMG 15093]
MRTTLSISVSKSKHITSAQQHHTERWDDSFNHSNRMISPNKSKQNINLTHNTGTYRERFENLIDQKYNGRRKKDGTPSIRKDAVRMFQVSVNLGEYDDKWNRTVLDKDKMVETLKNDIYPMLVEEFGGEDNILGAAIHMDESTPHLHLDVVPLTSDGKLSAKSFIDGPTDLSKKQTEWLEKAQEKRPDLNFERLEDQSLNGIEMEKLKKLTAQAKAEANEYLQKRNTALQEDIDAEWKILDEVDEKLNKKYDFLVSVQEEQEKTVEEFNKYGERLSVRESELNERERTLDETVNKRVAERTHERTRELDERERTIDETVNKRVEERTHGRTRELDERERTLDETVNKRVAERTHERTKALDKRESELNGKVSAFSKIKESVINALNNLPKMQNTLLAYIKHAKEEKERKEREEKATQIANYADKETDTVVFALEKEDFESVDQHVQNLEKVKSVTDEIEESKLELPAIEIDESQFYIPDKPQQTL